MSLSIASIAPPGPPAAAATARGRFVASSRPAVVYELVAAAGAVDMAVLPEPALAGPVG